MQRKQLIGLGMVGLGGLLMYGLFRWQPEGAFGFLLMLTGVLLLVLGVGMWVLTPRPIHAEPSPLLTGSPLPPLDFLGHRPGVPWRVPCRTAVSQAAGCPGASCRIHPCRGILVIRDLRLHPPEMDAPGRKSAVFADIGHKAGKPVRQAPVLYGLSAGDAGRRLCLSGI